MLLRCDPTWAEDLKSPAQRVRRISESWLHRECFCLRCRSNSLRGTTANTEFRDATCPLCGLGYELKSKAGPFKDVVADGGYEAMLRNIKAENAPVLMLMSYDGDWCVRHLTAVHPVFFTPSMVIRRNKPHLRPRSGKEYWMCNLDLRTVPATGRIEIVSHGIARNREEVRSDFQRVQKLEKLPFAQRGWVGAVLGIVRRLPKTTFQTSDLYGFASELQGQYPRNRHIEPKMRQQLQILARLGYLERTARGEYQLLAQAQSG